MDIRGIIRDSYLFGVDLIFSFLLFWGVEIVLFWAVLIHFVKDDDGIG